MSDDPNADSNRLELPEEILANPEAFELISAWFANEQVNIITRSGTALDESPPIWGQILAGIGETIALSIEDSTGADPVEVLAQIKASMDETWGADLAEGNEQE